MSKNIPVDPTNSLNINRISNGTVIVGTIDTSGDLRIDGRVEGTINSGGKVVIGETGKVKGDLAAKTLDIIGQFEGNITVADTTLMKPTAVVEGTLITEKLVVEVGARFDGTCTMGKKEQSKINVQLKPQAAEVRKPEQVEAAS